MKEPKVLDSYALLAYLKKEDEYEKVKSILSSGGTLYMNEVNLGETFYILAKMRGIDKAEYFTHTILPSLPIMQKANTFQDILGAARIKATHSLSYADCFAIHTAIKEGATLVTGDPEFKKVQKVVEIEWL